MADTIVDNADGMLDDGVETVDEKMMLAVCSSWKWCRLFLGGSGGSLIDSFDKRESGIFVVARVCCAEK